jgi:hypothetical protein
VLTLHLCMNFSLLKSSGLPCALSFEPLTFPSVSPEESSHHTAALARPGSSQQVCGRTGWEANLDTTSRIIHPPNLLTLLHFVFTEVGRSWSRSNYFLF